MSKVSMLDVIAPTKGLECFGQRLESTRKLQGKDKKGREPRRRIRWLFVSPPSARRDAPITFEQALAQRIARRKRMVEEAEAKRKNPRAACSVLVWTDKPEPPTEKQRAELRKARNIRKRERRALAGVVKPRVRRRVERKQQRVARDLARLAAEEARAVAEKLGEQQ